MVQPRLLARRPVLGSRRQRRRGNEGSLEWLQDSDGTTLFNSLIDAELDWRIYSSNLVSLTGLIHFRALEDFHATNFPSFEQFFADCRAGEL